jgi:hypothetical protein
LHAELISRDPGEEGVQSVVAVDVADVPADNGVSSRLTLGRLFVPAAAINCSQASSIVFHEGIRGVSSADDSRICLRGPA